jgi:hypothetical protein
MTRRGALEFPQNLRVDVIPSAARNLMPHASHFKSERPRRAIAASTTCTGTSSGALRNPKASGLDVILSARLCENSQDRIARSEIASAELLKEQLAARGWPLIRRATEFSHSLAKRRISGHSLSKGTPRAARSGNRETRSPARASDGRGRHVERAIRMGRVLVGNICRSLTPTLSHRSG